MHELRVHWCHGACIAQASWQGTLHALLHRLSTGECRIAISSVWSTQRMPISTYASMALPCSSGLSAWQHWYFTAAFTGLLGALLIVQASRVRCGHHTIAVQTAFIKLFSCRWCSAQQSFRNIYLLCYAGTVHLHSRNRSHDPS